MKRKNQKKNMIILLAVFAVSCLIMWTIWSNSALTVEEYRIKSERLPAAFSGFRIVHISDLHNAEFGQNNRKLLQKISECEPDIIVITGDLADARHTDLNVALSFAEGAAAIAPVYYVTGNHESRINEFWRLREGLEEAGVTVLEDQAVSVGLGGEEITLMGLFDPSFTLRKSTPEKVSAMVSLKLNCLMMEETDRYTVLLSHRPELFDTYADAEVDLALCGHAHGGQFRLPFVGGLFAPSQGWFPKYDAGLFQNGDTAMVVSRGLGNSSFPFRFNNSPEIVVVELEAVKK